ncbi:MAG TPA: SCO family protein [Bryobacteraceae bacterium]|nr:SCO family protein [Bryobacteraceae bacterium]HPU74094.1 SCO family protein [Bryobacteraceae bacterium]
MRLLAAFLAIAAATGLYAEQVVPPQLQGVGIDEKLGQQIDLSLTFTAENGQPVALGEFFNKGKPVILDLVYYSCPMLCTLVLNGQTTALENIPATVGKDFDVVTISIDPTETFELARQKREAYLAQYRRASTGWHFLVDRDGNVKKLADQVGFRYRYDEQRQQYAHAAAIMLLTPEGKVSRYLYGIKFNPRDVRLALAEAAQSKFSLSVDRVLLYCFQYDPDAQGYVLFARNLMKAGGAVTVLGIVTMVLLLRRREKKMAVVR